MRKQKAMKNSKAYILKVILDSNNLMLTAGKRIFNQLVSQSDNQSRTRKLRNESRRGEEQAREIYTKNIKGFVSDDKEKDKGSPG